MNFNAERKWVVMAALISFAIWASVVLIIIFIGGLRGQDMEEIVPIAVLWPILVAMIFIMVPFWCVHKLG
jgi:hypothetical protein